MSYSHDHFSDDVGIISPGYNSHDGNSPNSAKIDEREIHGTDILYGTAQWVQGIFATVWLIIFSIVGFGVDQNCDQPVIEHLIISIWLFVALIAFAIFTIGIECCIPREHKGIVLQIFDGICFGLTSIGFLYILASGVFALTESVDKIECNGAYYTIIVYTLFASMDAIFLTCALCCCLCGMLK